MSIGREIIHKLEKLLNIECNAGKTLAGTKVFNVQENGTGMLIRCYAKDSCMPMKFSSADDFANRLGEIEVFSSWPIMKSNPLYMVAKIKKR